MELNRVKDVLRKTTHSKSKLFVLLKLPADHPERFPEPDGYLNGGLNPVWLDATVDAYIAGLLQRSRGRRPRPQHEKSQAAA